jgi:nucleoside-diphosphate-sugar epimerase
MTEILPTDEIVITGGNGFVGRSLQAELRKKGFNNIYVFRSNQVDLRSQHDCNQLCMQGDNHVIIHLAATVGGIGANRNNPGRFFYDNMAMGLNLVEAARTYCNDLKKFVFVGSICSYPKHTPVPFSEKDFWNGYPEETNAPYGVAKKAVVEMIQAYHKQYDFPGVCLLPVNLYGPGDSLDIENNHVIPAMIIKFLQAVETNALEVELWGTGTPTREFMYVDDCARGIVKAMLRAANPEPMNLGSGREITISELAHVIAALVGFEGPIKFDATMPDGQPRRCLNTNRAWKEIGFETKVSLHEGLKRTIDWIKDNG